MYSGFVFNSVGGKELKEKRFDFGFLLVMFLVDEEFVPLAGIFALFTFSFCFV